MPAMGATQEPTDNPQAIVAKIGADVRKLAEALAKSKAKPAALETLKQMIPMLAQLTSDILGPEDQGTATPAPPPTPGEVLPPPSQSAAPAGGYLPGA